MMHPSVMRRLACCRRRQNKDYSLDFDEQDRVVTYSGLESCILNNESGLSRGDGCVAADSPDDASSCSSSKEAFGSSSASSQYLASSKREEEEEEHVLREWDALRSSHLICIKGKEPATYAMLVSDVDAMKESFAKLLLGEDTSGGARGVSTALALSNSITNLSANIFGELWKLEPLTEEKKSRWRREMDWLLSPTNYMVELVPAKQSGANGRMLEIMTTKARADVNMNLPALRKLDSMLIEVLDSMVDTEFWYAEGGSRNGRTRSTGIRQTKKWWLPSPQVPDSGLSSLHRKRIAFQGKIVHQVLKAAKSINEHVLLQMPIPSAVKDALPKSGRASLGEDIYQALTSPESSSVEKALLSLNLRNEHSVLEILNRIEGAIYAWKQKIADEANKKSPVRYPWYFVRESGSEVERVEVWLERAEVILRVLKNRFPNIPQTFISVTKVQYNKDVGYSIIEAYSRVIVSRAFSILSRIGDILQEDDLKKPTTPISTLKFDFSSDVYLAGITETPPGHIRRSLIDQMNMVDGRHCNSGMNKDGEELLLDSKVQAIVTVTASPHRRRAWW